MSVIVKHRIIGTIFFLSLLVIFMPMVFERHLFVLHTQTQIPIKPPIITAKEADKKLKPIDLSPDALAPAKLGAPLEEKKVIAGVAPLPLSQQRQTRFDGSGVPVAWTLQLATFKQRQNAEKLITTLKKKDYPAYLTIVYGKNKTELYRVLVGPKVLYAKLEILKDRLGNEFGINGIITRYHP